MSITFSPAMCRLEFFYFRIFGPHVPSPVRKRDRNSELRDIMLARSVRISSST